MAKILVADDETDIQALITQKFRQEIRNQKYEFIFAINGNDALEKISQNPDIDIVLSDINMPEMDGLTLLSRLNESNPLLKSVIVSAYGDMDNIRIAMNRGAFDFITKPINFDDLALTVNKTLNYVYQIRDTLKALKENNILKMYVDERVLNFMGSREFESSLEANETIEATVVFIDICSFTALSESEAPDVVITLLNQYFDVMVKVILEHGGYIDKFIGDSVMAVFKSGNHLKNCVEAGLEVRREIEALPPLFENLNFKPKITVGIHSGEMISGNIGSSALRRLDYTVIGDVVNTAQRLQSAAQQGQIIISEETFQKIKQDFTMVPVGMVTLKNKATPLQIYEVLNSETQANRP
ncbi:MAG: response regulator [Bacteroidetes bacterium]|nr:response regulator [Bacteroidota bacterium]